jgi:hypothetical protein
MEKSSVISVARDQDYAAFVDPILANASVYSRKGDY